MYAIREALNAFRRAPVLTGLSAAMIGLSLFVIGLFGLTAFNVRAVIRDVESRVELVAYLNSDASPAAVQTMSDEIATYDEVRSVRYISREEALAIARRDLDEDLQSIFGSIETNPLPASLEIALHPGQRGPEVVKLVAAKVAGIRGVEEVKYGEDWIGTFFALRRAAGVATLTLGLGFAAVAALIIGAAIRMAVFARRDEIVIMRLVGATDGFIRRPFVVEGMITGIIGAVIATTATWGTYRLLTASNVELSWIPVSWLFTGFVAGTAVGLVASAIAVRRHLREIN